MLIQLRQYSDDNVALNIDGEDWTADKIEIKDVLLNALPITEDDVDEMLYDLECRFKASPKGRLVTVMIPSVVLEMAS